MKSRSFFPVLRSRMRQKQEVDGNESHQEVELAKNSTLKPRQFCCSEWVFHHPPTMFYQLMCQWCYSWCSTCSSCAIRAPRVSDAHLCPPPTLGTVTFVLPFFPSPVEFCCAAESALEIFSPKAGVGMEDSSHIVLKMKSKKKSQDSSWWSKTFLGVEGSQLEAYSLSALLFPSHSTVYKFSSKIQLLEGWELVRVKRLLSSCCIPV